MSDVATAPPVAAPRKRAFAPEPSVDRTHLYETRGPLVWICVHAGKGVLMAMTGREAHWSHHGVLPSSLMNHPDAGRVAYVWMDEREAKAAMIAVSSFADFAALRFHQARCDVAQSRLRTDHAHVDETPLLHVSVAACHEGPLSGFPRLPAQRLDPKMRRQPVERDKVTVSRIAMPTGVADARP